MELPPDWSAFIESLSSHRVRFLVVGAHALAAIGAALADFGYPALAREEVDE